MNSPKLLYFEKDDVLHLVLQEGPEYGSFELSPDITVELNEAGEMIGVEILHWIFDKNGHFKPCEARCYQSGS